MISSVFPGEIPGRSRLALLGRRGFPLPGSVTGKADRGLVTKVNLFYNGGYAVNTAFSDASRIANALGYQFISLVPRQEINAFANLAKIAEEPDDEVESFRNADSVLLVQDSLGQPRYLVVEVSYRISGDDIRRARRNAEYLERFITMPSVGAVAGVRLTDNMKREAEANHVEWHQIRPT